MVENSRYRRLAILATCLAMIVVMLGAYTRLKNAGLGCPDWPTCYGQLTVPQSVSAVAKAQQAFPGLTVEVKKAWPEMIHRYFAGTLGLLIFFLAGWALLQRQNLPKITPLLLIAMMIFQAMLGMWTVTWQLLPLVVMGHLMGGMTIAGLLWWLSLSQWNPVDLAIPKGLHRYYRILALCALVAVATQIFLGGWTSANYASIICPHFPFCQGSLFPTMNFPEAFNFASPIGANYEGGLLGTTARVTIQMTHRYWAFVTATLALLLAFSLTANKKNSTLRACGWVLMSVITVQFLLGIANIDTLLALPVAVSHNGVALLLLLTIVTITHILFRGHHHDHARRNSNLA